MPRDWARAAAREREKALSRLLETMNQAEAGRVMGVSRQRVFQIVKRMRER